MRLENKTAVITGAGSGFGEGMALRFAEEGAKVVVSDINGDAAKRVADDIIAKGGQAIADVTDVTDAAQVQAMTDNSLKNYGSLDILVNNAGMPQRNAPMLETDEATFQKIYDVNVKSIFFTTKSVVPVMQEQKGGNILNIASTAALSPRPGLVWYNSSKGAVVTMTKAMAVELAPQQIRVNALCPVIAMTGMTVEFMGGEDTPEIREKFQSTIPLGRMNTPRDLANAALYLTSDEASFITGVAMEVDGGRCI
ncbi:glucose 1-dehydrogenase [Sneathiella sp. P13V-1]|uniref:glucose 1-dehydrogenase n=1 Tax=Sneathiella sp. P13V-1 TaxID=2697366 RepID=UPI00187B3F86|nr:glucose 1-dehydrogenase [Sneathiella sp. P13V-1]MBE7637378.1 glucose 1-dehydrogenase [Sneathiella sp. P13V-1]